MGEGFRNRCVCATATVLTTTQQTQKERNSNWYVIYELNFCCGSLNLPRQVGEHAGAAALDVFRLCLRVEDVFHRLTLWCLWTFPTLSADGNKSMCCSAHLPCQAKPTQATNDRAHRPHFMHVEDVERSRLTALKITQIRGSTVMPNDCGKWHVWHVRWSCTEGN